MNIENDKIMSTDYKLFLNNITKNYMNDLKLLKTMLEKAILNANIDNFCLYQSTLNETNEIIDSFTKMYKRYKAKQGMMLIQPTRQEYEIMCLIYENKTIAEIQEELCISTNTVNTHLKHILEKIQDDEMFNHTFKNDSSEIIENNKKKNVYKLKKPYETIKKFVNIDFYPD